MREKCEKCGSESKQQLYGKDMSGKQRYRCCECRKVYIIDVQYTPEFKQQAMRLYFEGNSGRAVGRIMGISKNTIWLWLKEYAQNIEEQAEGDVEIAEMDELYTYIKKGSVRRVYWYTWNLVSVLCSFCDRDARLMSTY